MAKFKPQYRRLLFIDRKFREGGFPNCTTLANEQEVSVKTVQRDLEYLRDELDAPLEYDAVRHGYFYTEPDFALPALHITESDFFAICLARHALRQFRHTPVHNKLASIFSKISESLPGNTHVRASWLDERIILFPEAATVVKPAIWDTIAQAMRDSRRLSIIHESPGGKPHTTRQVDPYFLVNHKGEWYLNSFCHTRRAIRTFAVSRIRKAAILPDPFVFPAGMSPKKMFGDQFGIIWKDAFHKVRIRFSAEVAPYIRERKWHPAQKITPHRNGNLTLEFTTNHLNEVKDWVLSWGATATVLAPPVLVDKVRADLARALKHYAARARPRR